MKILVLSIFIFLIPGIILIVFLLRPELLLGSATISASKIWSFLGTFFSYLGLIFSIFAVLEVRSLSNRYYAKQRLPDIRKQLTKLTKKMLDKQGVSLTEIRTSRILSEVPVLLRQLKKIKVSDFSSIVKKAEANHTKFKNDVQKSDSSDKEVSDLDVFWELYQNLAELEDEIAEHQKGALANL